MWEIVEHGLCNQKKMRFQREHISCEVLLRKEAHRSLSNWDPRQRAKARREQVLLGEGEVWLSLMISGGWTGGRMGRRRSGPHPQGGGLGFSPGVIGMGRTQAGPGPWAC